MITPTSINTYRNIPEKAAIPTNDRQQVSFLDLLVIDDHTRNLTIGNAESRLDSEAKSRDDIHQTSSLSGDEAINLFAGMQVPHPSIKQLQKTNPSVAHIIPEPTSASLVTEQLGNANGSYIYQIENADFGFLHEQTISENIHIPVEDDKWNALINIDTWQLLDTTVSHNQRQLTPSGGEFFVDNIILLQQDTDNSLLQVTVEANCFTVLPEQTTWQTDISKISNSIIQHDNSLSLTTVSFSNQQSVSIDSRLVNAVDLKWYATGKLSETAKITQILNTSNSTSVLTSIDKLAAAGSTDHATPLQNDTRILSVQRITAYESDVNRSWNRSLPGNEKALSQNLVATAIALNFPELSKWKLTVVENNGMIDVIVRDYELSDNEKESLSVFLTHYFKGAGKIVNSLTFNGKLYG